MTTLEDYRKFVRVFPKHRFQPGALAAYEAALLSASPSDLQFAARRFAAEVRKARPNGAAWKYCPGPARWLAEERWRAYLPETREEQP